VEVSNGRNFYADQPKRRILRAPPTSGLSTSSSAHKEEIPMLAIVAAVLFLVALVFELSGFALGVLTATVLVTAGLLCLALQMAGVLTDARKLIKH